MAKKITAIPATKNLFADSSHSRAGKRRVCGYARVSTNYEEQESSYEAQMDYYTNYIKSRPDWEFVDMYSDEGISGTNTKRREGFNKMINDALNGKIDLIITKSVSRFARNTVDSLTTIRKLKEKGVEVYFEKENIWTLDAKGELLITIMSSLAQEESRSISENTTWGRRKRFADGKVDVAFGMFLGYERGENDEWVVNEEQAVTVRLIYQLFLGGLSFDGIKKELESRGIKAPGGGDRWHTRTINSILTNEKYKGDALLQKRYTADFLTKKMVKNNGEVPQYYVKGHHEAIISPQTFEIVQKEIARRKHGGNRYQSLSIFASRIICGECGCTFGRRVWHSNEKSRRIVWQCRDKYNKRRVTCRVPHVTEKQVQDGFIEAHNELVKKYNPQKDLENIASLKEELEHLNIHKGELEDEIDGLVMKIDKLANDFSRNPSEDAKHEKKYNSLLRKYNKKKDEYDTTVEKISSTKYEIAAAEVFYEALKKDREQLKEFDMERWGCLLEHATVNLDGTVVYKFRNGFEYKIVLNKLWSRVS